MQHEIISITKLQPHHAGNVKNYYNYVSKLLQNKKITTKLSYRFVRVAQLTNKRVGALKMVFRELASPDL